MLKNTSHRFGELIEQQACFFLQELGFEILTRRYRIRGGEIDIVAKSGDVLVFCEVKARKKVFDYDAVFSQKQLSRILITAERYVNDNPSFSSCNIRFDLFIFENCTKRLLHFENITM
ncbi:MAG: hypothetical protein RL208_273 [Pseudomonadota bacterium]|jgi:putative endonuclease